MPLRIRRATAAGLGLWMLTGLVLFSHMARLHPRYVEGFTPAVAALLGIGLAWATAPRGRAALVALAVAMVVTVYYAERLLYGTEPVWWVVLAGALGALAASPLLARRLAARARVACSAPATLACALVAVLAVGVKADVTRDPRQGQRAGFVGQLPGDVQRTLSAYLQAHNHGARYELAAESATQIGSLIVQDAQPIVVLTTYNATRVHVSREAEADDRRRPGPLRLPEHVLRTHKPPRSTPRARRPCCGSANTAPTSRAQAGLPHGKRPLPAARGEAVSGAQAAAGAGELIERAPRRGPAGARHGVHGRGPLPHAAVPDPAGGARAAPTGESIALVDPLREDARAGAAGGGARGPGRARSWCTPVARTSRCCAASWAAR